MELQSHYQTIGQSLYQSIQQPWLSAQVSFQPESTDDKVQASFVCKNQKVNELDVSKAVCEAIENIYYQAKQKSNESWQRVVFFITRDGDFKIDFQQDAQEHDLLASS
ncbi:hypothetical protein HR060_15435 [Catenovulum sp. SM1970]|uniref:hypothetical protein n=1 Tax=Marinifaba aquimaris TaxID=2741323 RepID=UPI0015729004|nr:hypothetical protein [Marinifaba aquimaris]NTS78243.1 hypothetical protein [Marinifaba aquimaris]